MTVFRPWAAALLLAGCAAQTPAPSRSSRAGEAPIVVGRREVGVDAMRVAVGRVELCKTTEADLRASFGTPMRDGRVGRYRVQSWLVGKEPERILAVLLDARAVVVDLSWDAPGVLTWVPRDSCGPGN